MKIWKLALAIGVGLALSASGTSAQQKLTFTLNWVAGGDHAPYFYAQKMGWYKDAGINIDFETGRGSAASAHKTLRSRGRGDDELAGTSRHPCLGKSSLTNTRSRSRSRRR